MEDKKNFALDTGSGLTYLTWPEPAAKIAYYENGISREMMGSKMYPVIAEDGSRLLPGKSLSL